MVYDSRYRGMITLLSRQKIIWYPTSLCHCPDIGTCLNGSIIRRSSSRCSDLFKLLEKPRTQEQTNNHASFGDDWPAEESSCWKFSINDIKESTASWDFKRKFKATVFVTILPVSRYAISVFIREMVVFILLIICCLTPDRLSGTLKFL